MKVSQYRICTWMICITLLMVSCTHPSTFAFQAGRADTSTDPDTFDLETSDGVILNCVFYPGTKEKQSIPVILLHEWDSEGEEMVKLASHLQKSLGCAVIVPDLRGHGDSKTIRGGDKDLDRDRWRATEIAAISKDIETCKKFLIKKNNEGELNIDLLTVVASGESIIHALQWTIQDWSYSNVGGVKQGKDVKGLVLLSPVRAFKGLNVNDAVKNPLFTSSSMPIMIAVNDRSSSRVRDAKNINDRLKRGRAASADADDTDDELEYYRYRLVKNQEMVSRKSGDRPLYDVIQDFVQRRIEANKDQFRWQDRSK